MTRLSVCEESEDQAVPNESNKQNGQICRKRKRHLEVLSIACSTLGMNLVIACFLGVTNALGFKSPDMVFQCAFAFLLLSVILGVMAMISSSTNKPEWSGFSWFSSSKNSLFNGFFRRRRSSEHPEKILRINYEESNNSKSSPVGNGFKQVTARYPREESATVYKDSELSKQSSRKVPSVMQVNDPQSTETAFSRVPNSPGNTYKRNSSDSKNLVGHTDLHLENMSLARQGTSSQNENSRLRSKQLEKLPRVNEKSFSPETSACSSFDLSQRKDKSSYGKVHLQLKKKHTACLFGQTTTVLSPSQFAKTSRFVFYDVENNSNKTTGSIPVTEERTFITEFTEIPFQKQIRQRGWFAQMTEKGFVSYSMENTRMITSHNNQRRFASVDETSWELPKDQISTVASKLNEMNFKY